MSPTWRYYLKANIKIKQYIKIKDKFTCWTDRHLWKHIHHYRSSFVGRSAKLPWPHWDWHRGQILEIKEIIIHMKYESKIKVRPNESTNGWRDIYSIYVSEMQIVANRRTAISCGHRLRHRRGMIVQISWGNDAICYQMEIPRFRCWYRLMYGIVCEPNALSLPAPIWQYSRLPN